MFFKGDVFVGLFTKSSDPYMNNCHWSLVFNNNSFNDMEVIHVKGSYVDGWQFNRMSKYSALNSSSLLRLVHIGRVRDHTALIQKIAYAIPVVNRDYSFDCRVWVARAISYMIAEGRIVVKNNNVEALLRECQYYADSAVTTKRTHGDAAKTHLDPRAAQCCTIPGFNQWL